MYAHEWLTRVFEPVVRAIPYDLRAKLEPAEVFHQVLEHRWYMSQAEGRSVPLAEVLTSYINDVLRHRRDEATIMGPPTETMIAARDHGIRAARRGRIRRRLARPGLTPSNREWVGDGQ